MVQASARDRSRRHRADAGSHAANPKRPCDFPPMSSAWAGETLGRRRWRSPLTVALSAFPIDQEYWLAHCEGYRVDSDAGQLGLVDEVCSTPTGHPDLLVLRAGRFGHRRLLVPAEEVMAVTPREERIVVRSPVRILASVLR